MRQHEACLAADPWILGFPLFLYCLLAAHLRTTCVNALCGVNCLLLSSIQPPRIPIPASQPSPLIGLTNAAALVSPHVVPFQPFLLLSPFLHALLHPLFTTSSPLPSSPFRSHSSRRHHRPLRWQVVCINCNCLGLYTKHVKDAMRLLLLRNTEGKVQGVSKSIKDYLKGTKKYLSLIYISNI